MTPSILQAPSRHRQPPAGAPAEPPDAAWTWLYRTGGVAAAFLAVLMVLQSVIFFVVPPPSTVGGWFALFQSNGLLGLLAFELLMVVYVVVSVPVVLALAVSLRRTSPALTVIYVALSLVGIALFIAARPAFEMLSLSGQYAAATTDAERARFLAAGEVMLAVFQGTAFQVSYVLGSIGGLIISAVMLRSALFSKATASVRIGSSLLDFGLYLPVIGLVLSLLSVLWLLVWNILIARRLLQLGQGGASAAAKRP